MTRHDSDKTERTGFKLMNDDTARFVEEWGW
jgi:hypothetical protein